MLAFWPVRFTVALGSSHSHFDSSIAEGVAALLALSALVFSVALCICARISSKVCSVYCFFLMLRLKTLSSSSRTICAVGPIAPWASTRMNPEFS